VTQDNHDKYGLSKGDILYLLIDDGTDVPFFSCRDTAVHCALSRIKPYTGDRTMKLLELLCEELPKRGGWPQWAAAAVQGDWTGEERISFAGQKYDLRHDGEKWTSSGHGGTWGENSNSNSDFTASTLASDHATRIVTREEYERAAAIKASEDMVKSAIQRLTDAITTKSDKVNDTGETITLHFPAGYHVQTPLQRIEQLRKARDEAVRAYNDAFVSGEVELRKLKQGDKVMFPTEEDTFTLAKILVKGNVDNAEGYEWVFHNDRTGEELYILTPAGAFQPRFAPL
ncbi:MAG: hypothetical protein ACRCWC_14660, partial [Plesiomonas shigelloides]